MSSIPVKDDDETRARASRIVADGGVIGFRTDTFYGLGADPFNRAAVSRINSLKGRDGVGKPVLVVISDRNEAERFTTDPSTLFNSISERHWPGALTIVVGARPEVPDELTAGSRTIGLRLPDDEKVRVLIRACGGALTATSANLAGEPPARTAEEVATAFHSLLDLIIDGGKATGDKPSTVLDLSGEHPRLIRDGAVSRSQLQETLRALGEEI
ncbi:MAG TPA: L-threonylcarbamoyladenylate synthase [Pyrinomonadaceae bacterium]|nr:L-threonylcarbamoyladenylate synthase [Pyrinomonadaceae bacterium]